MKKELMKLATEAETKLIEKLMTINAKARNDTKRFLLNTFAQIEKMKPAELAAAAAAYKAKKQSDAAAEEAKKKVEAEEAEWKLESEEITNRVRSIRRELEAAKRRYDGTMFYILTEGKEPRSLSTIEEVREPYELATSLYPALKGHYDRSIDGTDSDDDGCLYFEGPEVGFQIGILAGFIFAGADKREIDRAEAGLVHAVRMR